MSLNRYAAKRDKVEASIVDALRAVGAGVWKLKEPCDLLVRFKGYWFVLECKDPGVKRPDKRQERQNEFIATTGCPVVRTVTEALIAIGAL